MKKDIFASIFHSASTDKAPQHSYCPEGTESWCFYQRSIAMKKDPGSHQENIHNPINALCLEKILPLYQRLTDESLLLRCSRCATQNANESLHSCIWNKCPKQNFVGKERVKLAASLAVCEYNFGCQKTISALMNELCLENDFSSAKLYYIDKYKVNKALSKKINAARTARAAISTAVTNSKNILEEKEEVSYSPGLF